MTQIVTAFNDVRELYSKFVGQPAPEIGPGWYAPFPAGVDPVRYAIYEVEELKRLLTEARTPEVPVAWIPRADVYARRDAVVIRVETPGVEHDQLKVLIAEDACIVRGERALPKDDDALRPLGLESPHGTFERRFPLPLHADPAKLAAKYTDGILEVTIPLLEIAAPKEMKIEIA